MVNIEVECRSVCLISSLGLWLKCSGRKIMLKKFNTVNKSPYNTSSRSWQAERIIENRKNHTLDKNIIMISNN